MSLLEDHYETVREQRGYDDVAVAIGGLSEPYCRERFAFTDDDDELEAATPAETLVSVGISLTGGPHVGTLGQMQTAIDFQRAGFDVQVVLADLVVYNSGGARMETLARRARRYRSFVRTRGFDSTTGRLVTQSDAPDILSAAFRLARRYEPDADPTPDHDPTAFEETLATAYDDVGQESDATEFSQQLAGLLLFADNATPLLEDSYERVILALGADNVGLGRRVDASRERASVTGSVVGLYSRLVAGVDDTPKMSKSIPGSDIHLGMDPDRIHELVCDPALDATRPPESVVYQMLRHASPFSPAELTALREACAGDTREWAAAKREYAVYLSTAAAEWQATA